MAIESITGRVSTVGGKYNTNIHQLQNNLERRRPGIGTTQSYSQAAKDTS
jgi:hypothetical protein